MTNYSVPPPEWITTNGKDFLINHDLSPDSVLFEFGGFHGDWVDVMYNKYNCNISVFEPILSYYNILIERFGNNDKIKIFNYGLLDSNCYKEMCIKGDATHIVDMEPQYTRENVTFPDEREKCKFLDFKTILTENNISNIDLMQVNIEGFEYDVFNNICDDNLLTYIDKLQVQFHYIDESSIDKRLSIRDKLQNAGFHETFNYIFTWEGWSRK